MSLTPKLVLAFMALAVGALVVALAVTTLVVERGAEQKAFADLELSLEDFQKVMALHQQTVQRAAEVRSRDRTFLEVALGSNSDDAEAGLGEADSELQAIQEVRETILSADTEVFGWRGGQGGQWAFFNARRRLVFTHGDDAQYGAVVDEPLLRQALRTGKAVALWSPARLRALPFSFVPPEYLRERDLLLVHAHRVTDLGSDSAGGRAPRSMGVVLTGHWVRDLLGGQAASASPGGRQDALLHFALRAPDGALATTLEAGSPLEAPGFTAPTTRLIPISTGTGTDRYLVRESAFSQVGEAQGAPVGQLFVLRNLDGEIKPVLRSFRFAVGLTAVVVVLGALGAAVLLARRLSAPLVQLEAAARQVRLGDLSVSLPARGTDEVGRLTLAFNEMVDGLRQRDQIKGLFKRYLDPQVVEELLRNPDKAAPGGERKELSVLFCDLVGFTSLSEHMEPEALVDLLNGYFERATEVLRRHGATLDKFIGDAIMCFWNAPLSQEDHAARACLTALELVAAVDALAPELQARGLARLDCRIGLHTGQAVAGNIGSRAAQDYTVIGDTVNLASRLEGAAKVYGTRTLVTEETVQAARGAVLARELDLLRVKGRQNPVRVYELVAVAGSAPPAHLAVFAKGLELYRRSLFDEATEVFLSLPDDPPSRTFAERCQVLAKAPPEQWDGIFSLDTK